MYGTFVGVAIFHWYPAWTSGFKAKGSDSIHRITTCELQVERETFMKEGLEFQPLSTGLVLSHQEE